MDLFSKGAARRQYITVPGLSKRYIRLSKRYIRLSSAKSLNQNEQDQYGKNKLEVGLELA